MITERSCRPMTQTDRILWHLNEARTITPMEALKLYGCFRLAARISEIKDLGYEVESKMVSAVNRFGDDIRFKMYWINEPDD